jgi:hypothetical protein
MKLPFRTRAPAAGSDEPAFGTFDRARRVKMMAVTDFWLRVAEWDERRAASRPRNPRRVLREGLCAVAIPLVGLVQMLFGALALRIWYAWIYAGVLLALAALSARLATWRWRRETARG